jgi:dienelactone hydrolase
VEGYLLFPASAPQSISAFPAVVALHPTTNASIDEIAGVSGSESAKTGLKLVSRGYVVFCPRCFLWQNATSLDDAVSQHRKRHPNTKGMAKMLYDAMRAVDVLEAIPYVDRKRIGAIGHSLGAKEVLYLMAFDDRVRAGVASEGGIAFRSTNWNAPWYLSTAIDDEAFPLNHHQLLGMIAPRPFLVLGGESGPGAADGDRSWTLIEAALPVWRLSGKPIRLGLLNHHEGHKLSDASFEKMDAWMRCYLASEKPNPR